MLPTDEEVERQEFINSIDESIFSLMQKGQTKIEAENARIRGTLATTTFEKESVNAVGGQLYVANSTTIKSGSIITAAATTMSVDNVSGFTGSYGDGHGEILSLKKINPTGFTTEYIKVQSASRLDPTSDTNFSGQLSSTVSDTLVSQMNGQLAQIESLINGIQDSYSNSIEGISSTLADNKTMQSLADTQNLLSQQIKLLEKKNTEMIQKLQSKDNHIKFP